ncbi:MAG: twin-arginine translocase subunit TatC [Verrucomicrobiota bacterium]
MTILKTALEKLFRLRETSTKRPSAATGEDGEGPVDPHEKPFLDHLEDLRVMFMKMIVVQIVFTIACFIFHRILFHWMFTPLKLGYPAREDGSVLFDHIKFEFLAPQEGFMLSLKVCFFAGLILALPLHTYFLAQFVLPGLTDKEKKFVIPGVLVGFFLFLTGASFAFFGALPYAFDFLNSYSSNITGQEGPSTWRTGYYIGFVSQVILIFGLAFELPVVTTILVKLQILTYRTMASSRSFAIIILCVLSAILTPPDPFTMVMLALPMIILYEICVWIAYFLDKKREAKEAEEEAEYQEWLAKQEEKEDGDDDDDPDGGPKALTDGGPDDPSDPPSPVSAAEQPYDYDADHAGMEGLDDEHHDEHGNPWPEDDDHYVDHDHPNYDPQNFEKYGDYYGPLEDIECPEDRRNVARARKARELAKNTQALSNLLIDINNCSIDELKSLPGIGPKLAQEIIDHRPYGAPTELLELPGISESKYAPISLRIFAG